MMEPEDVKQLLTKVFPDADVDLVDMTGSSNTSSCIGRSARR